MEIGTDRAGAFYKILIWIQTIIVTTLDHFVYYDVQLTFSSPQHIRSFPLTAHNIFQENTPVHLNSKISWTRHFQVKSNPSLKYIYKILSAFRKYNHKHKISHYTEMLTLQFLSKFLQNFNYVFFKHKSNKLQKQNGEKCKTIQSFRLQTKLSTLVFK